MYDNEIFIENLKKHRKRLKMKSSEFALAIDLHYSHLSDIECGRKLPTSKIAVSIVNYFGLGINDFLNESNKAEQKDIHINTILSLLKSFDEKELDFLYNVALTYKDFEV